MGRRKHLEYYGEGAGGLRSVCCLYKINRARWGMHICIFGKGLAERGGLGRGGRFACCIRLYDDDHQELLRYKIAQGSYVASSMGRKKDVEDRVRACLPVCGCERARL